ncbi:hypothetical protein J6590_036400, partial [Homalodisca vitripennis]
MIFRISALLFNNIVGGKCQKFRGVVSILASGRTLRHRAGAGSMAAVGGAGPGPKARCLRNEAQRNVNRSTKLVIHNFATKLTHIIRFKLPLTHHEDRISHMKTDLHRISPPRRAHDASRYLGRNLDPHYFPVLHRAVAGRVLTMVRTCPAHRGDKAEREVPTQRQQQCVRAQLENYTRIVKRAADRLN